MTTIIDVFPKKGVTMMRLYAVNSSLENIDSLTQEPSVLALGFFDGVHCGHQHVIAKAQQIAKEKNLICSVMTFHPHPKEVLSNGINYLMPVEKKVQKLRELGIDQLYLIHFDRQFAAVTAQTFIEKYVIAQNVKHVVCGYDFTYGAKGMGNVQTLMLHANGEFDVTIVSKIECMSEKISSTKIRELLGSGEVDQIPNYLGSFYEACGYISEIAFNDYQIELLFTLDKGYSIPQQGVYQIKLFYRSRAVDGFAQIIDPNAKTMLIFLQAPLYFLSESNPVSIQFYSRMVENKKTPTSKHRTEFDTAILV